jgi:hypothetical protein
LFGTYREDKDFWIITDVRFKNEAEIIKKRGGIIIRLNGDPNNSRVGDDRNMSHQSEIDLDGYDRFDYIYDNVPPISNLKNFVKEVSKNLFKNNMKIPKIGIDIDGCIANFTLAWHELYPEIPSDPDRYDFDKNIMQRFDDMREAGTLDDFYLGIKPLLKPKDLPFEPICYITARPVDTKITEQWIDACGFPKKKVITVPTGTSKVDVMKDAGIDIFIDDYYGNFIELNNAGIFTYLYTQPWNIKHDVGHLRLNSLKDLPFLKT